MSKVFPELSGYRPLQRRQIKTLCHWLTELNRWHWPKEIERLTERSSPERLDKFRTEVMDEIFRELGFRSWIKESK